MLIRVLLIACTINYVCGTKSLTKHLSVMEKIHQIQAKLLNPPPESTSKNSESLKKIKDDLFLKMKPNSAAKGILEDLDDTSCFLCQNVATTFLELRRNDKKNSSFLRDMALEMCLDLEIQPEDVCVGIIDLHLPIILFIVDEKPEIDAEDICATLLQTNKCGDVIGEESFKVKVDANSSKIEKSKQSSKTSNETMKIVHITDIHFDPKYLVGGLSDCEETICCREIIPENSTEEAAGLWGDYNYCGSPWASIVDALDQIKKDHSDLDLLYFTGDIVNHAIWETSEEDNMASMNKTYNLIKDVFPLTQVYPILGNHDAHPVNLFPPKSAENFTMPQQNLYNSITEIWSKWLPESSLETVRIGGYYTVLVRPGFRIIALNNNEGYTYNWWIFYDHLALLEQLQWLHDTLLDAEKAEEKVHILLHIPSGEENIYIYWSREYSRIVERFSNTIQGQFQGHSHLSQVSVFYTEDDSSIATNVAFSGGGLNTYYDINRNYMVYPIDSESYEVLNVESWIYNLTEANLTPDSPPKWFKHISFKEQFDLEDLSPASVDDMVYGFITDPKMLQKYHQFRVKAGDPYQLDECDTNCQKKDLCEIVSSDGSRNDKCKELESAHDLFSSPVRQLFYLNLFPEISIKKKST